MPEHLRALVVILAISIAIFTIWKKTAAKLLAEPGEFERRRNLWIGILLATFLPHNFWLFILFTAILLHLAAANDREKVGLVLFVLLAVPLIRGEIPGPPGIRYLFEIDFFRLISLVIFLPLLLQNAGKNSLSYIDETPDKLLYSYLILNLALILIASTITATLRIGFIYLLDIVIPYAVVSRSSSNFVSMRAAVASYVIGASVIAGIGFFESIKGWLLYSSLEDALGVVWGYGGYLKREENLRAIGSAGQAIPLGYAMATGFCLMLGLRHFFQSKILWWGGLTLLTLGMIAAYSRGPWVGAVAGLMVFLLSAPKAGANISRLSFAAVLIVPIMTLSPLGEKLFDAATVESGSFDYRQRVFEISTGVIMANPLFGAWDAVYSPAMQELKQGQGIIDIVNTYIAIGLRCGLVGLALFSGFFAVISIRLWKCVKYGGQDKGPNDIGRALLAALVCTLVTIATVSSITFVPVIYYLLAGLSVSYIRCCRSSTKKTKPNQAFTPQNGRHRDIATQFR